MAASAKMHAMLDDIHQGKGVMLDDFAKVYIPMMTDKADKEFANTMVSTAQPATNSRNALQRIQMKKGGGRKAGKKACKKEEAKKVDKPEVPKAVSVALIIKKPKACPRKLLPCCSLGSGVPKSIAPVTLKPIRIPTPSSSEDSMESSSEEEEVIVTKGIMAGPSGEASISKVVTQNGGVDLGSAWAEGPKARTETGLSAQQIAVVNHTTFVLGQQIRANILSPAGVQWAASNLMAALTMGSNWRDSHAA